MNESSDKGHVEFGCFIQKGEDSETGNPVTAYVPTIKIVIPGQGELLYTLEGHVRSEEEAINISKVSEQCLRAERANLELLNGAEDSDKGDRKH